MRFHTVREDFATFEAWACSNLIIFGMRPFIIYERGLSVAIRIISSISRQ